MKKFFFIVITGTFSLTLFSQIWIQPKGATKHKGDSVNLIGFVTNAKHATNREGTATLLIIETNNSKQSLTLLVFNSDRVKFKEAPEITYLNQYVQVTGIVGAYKGSPGIILHSEQQISITRDAGPDKK